MPSIGFVLWMPGAALLGFFYLIWRGVDSAILDEEYLTDWLLTTLG